jgi:myo-inositol-1-phosphate synthase
MLLNVAQSARLDPLKIRIMVIGLGGNATSFPVKTATLQCVANAAPCTVAGQRVGLYVYAPTSTQLMSAFRQVASAISHLMQ